MKNAKHTPGPWKTNGQSIKSKTRMICHTSIGDTECKANARLIAAAPEMLELLADVLSVNDLCAEHEYMIKTLLARIERGS